MPHFASGISSSTKVVDWTPETSSRTTTATRCGPGRQAHLGAVVPGALHRLRHLRLGNDDGDDRRGAFEQATTGVLDRDPYRDLAVPHLTLWNERHEAQRNSDRERYDLTGILLAFALADTDLQGDLQRILCLAEGHCSGERRLRALGRLSPLEALAVAHLEAGPAGTHIDPVVLVAGRSAGREAERIGGVDVGGDGLEASVEIVPDVVRGAARRPGHARDAGCGLDRRHVARQGLRGPRPGAAELGAVFGGRLDHGRDSVEGHPCVLGGANHLLEFAQHLYPAQLERGCAVRLGGDHQLALLVEGGEEAAGGKGLDPRRREDDGLATLGCTQSPDQSLEGDDRAPLAIDLLLRPVGDLVFEPEDLALLHSGPAQLRRRAAQAHAVAAVGTNVLFQLPLLAAAEPGERRPVLELVERLGDRRRVGGRQEEDAQVLFERRHHHAVAAGGSGAQELAQLPDGLEAGTILECRLVDVENQVRRRDRLRKRGRSDRKQSETLRRNRRRSREARRREVLDRHGVAVHEKLEIVLFQVQDPSLLAVGHDDVDIHDLDLDALGEGLRPGSRLLAQQGQQGPGGEEDCDREQPARGHRIRSGSHGRISRRFEATETSDSLIHKARAVPPSVAGSGTRDPKRAPI